MTRPSWVALHSMTRNFIELDKAVVHVVRLVSFLWFCFSFCLPSDGGEGNGNPLQYSCLESPMDGGAWLTAVHGVTKSRTWLSDFPFTFHFHVLEKEMATLFSILAWRIPGTVEPGGLLSMGSMSMSMSMGSHRVRHNWNDLAAATAAAATLWWRRKRGLCKLSDDRDWLKEKLCLFSDGAGHTQ